MAIANILGGTFISDAVRKAVQGFVSLLWPEQSKAYSGLLGFRQYTRTRGILISKEYTDGVGIDLDKGYIFQFNPQTINDVKSTLYEVRPYPGLPYNDLIWINGGERIISFQLFLDNTPSSKTSSFRPKVLAQEISPNRYKGDYEDFFWVNNGAYSKTRVHPRGILPEVEYLQSLLYPEVAKSEETPKFAEGGVVNMEQFRPPAVVVFCFGPIYLEGVVKRADISYQLFDEDLTPLRATVDIDFSVMEYRNLDRKITVTR